METNKRFKISRVLYGISILCTLLIAPFNDWLVLTQGYALYGLVISSLIGQGYVTFKHGDEGAAFVTVCGFAFGLIGLTITVSQLLLDWQVLTLVIFALATNIVSVISFPWFEHTIGQVKLVKLIWAHNSNRLKQLVEDAAPFLGNKNANNVNYVVVELKEQISEIDNDIQIADDLIRTAVVRSNSKYNEGRILLRRGRLVRTYYDTFSRKLRIAMERDIIGRLSKIEGLGEISADKVRHVLLENFLPNEAKRRRVKQLLQEHARLINHG